jgi:beta-lactamase superfamily II metal-dependent hydrolase
MARDLEIHFIDVEGGQATLIVSPSGESMLVDAGWPGFNGRDADRIVAAAKSAGLKQIDYMLVTHYHLDHVGGVPPLAKKIPIRNFVDHGANTETGERSQALTAAYEKTAAAGKRITVKPGDRIPLKGVEVEVVAARGERIAKPIPGGGAANPACSGVEPQAEDKSENARSVGFVLRHGRFRFVDLGDLTWNKELEIACPANLIGTADVYLVTHHGMDISNAPPIVQGIRPRVAVMNNGSKKGGSPEAWRWIRKSPGLEDLWQLHFAVKGGAEANSPEQLIANLEDPCQGHSLKLTARSDGSFTITNSRNQFAKTYQRK